MNKKEISASSARISHKITSWKIKMPSLPLRGARTEHTNSAVPPCLPENSDRSAERQHALCPLTLALRQKILRGSSLFSLPSAAQLLPRSSPRSQPPGLSVDALAALLPLRWFGRYVNCSFYTSGLSVCQALFFAWGKHFWSVKGRAGFLTIPEWSLRRGSTPAGTGRPQWW